MSSGHFKGSGCCVGFKGHRRRCQDASARPLHRLTRTVIPPKEDHWEKTHFLFLNNSAHVVSIPTSCQLSSGTSRVQHRVRPGPRVRPSGTSRLAGEAGGPSSPGERAPDPRPRGEAAETQRRSHVGRVRGSALAVSRLWPPGPGEGAAAPPEPRPGRAGSGAWGLSGRNRLFWRNSRCPAPATHS